MTTQTPSLQRLKKPKQYSSVSIYNAGGNLSARWYVYYSFRNPQTGYLERQPSIYMNINDYDTLRERNKAAKIVQTALENILKSGYSPFEQNTETPKQPLATDKTVVASIDFTLTLSEKMLSATSYTDYKSRVNQFKAWLLQNNLGNAAMADITHETVMQFLNEVLQRSSARNRNNTRAALSSMYKILLANKIVKVNLLEHIDKLRSVPKKNKTYTTKQEESILTLLQEKDPLLLLFVQFISFNLLRPIEVCRLKVSDINIKDRVLRVQTKNQSVKTKIIPEVMLNNLPDLSCYTTTDYLFTPTGVGAWDTKEINRRNYFSNRFKKIKDALQLGEEYGLYSFRHTYITKLYRELRKTASPFETKSKLMLITGHTSMTALEKYLRDIDAELPEDYSDLLR